MSYSEYLRRKTESLPKYYGVPRLGDESTRIDATRYKAAAPPGGVAARRDPATSARHTCCDGSAGPYHREGDGQQQEWTRDGITAAAAGCAICGAGRPAAVSIPCCPQESTVEIPRDASGNPTDPRLKPEAYKGRVTCPPFFGPPVSSLPPNCCDRPAPGHINTLAANNVPADRIPVPPGWGPRCCPVATCSVCICGDTHP